MQIKKYNNKRLGSFVSIPISLVNSMSPVDTIYMAINFKKLSTELISRVRSSKHYKSTTSSWEKKLENVDKHNMAEVANALGINLEVFNPLAQDSKTSFSGGSRARRNAQILKVKDGVYKPMIAGAVARQHSHEQGEAQIVDSEAQTQKFIRVMNNENSTVEEIRDAVEYPTLLIDTWNEILPDPLSEDTLILRVGKIDFDDSGRIRADFFEEVKHCSIMEDDTEPIKINEIEYSDYPTCPLNYEGIGFSTENRALEPQWTGQYYYYMKRKENNPSQFHKTCFNKSAFDRYVETNPDKANQSPLTREPMVSIFKLVTELVKYSNIPEKVKDHLKNLYADYMDDSIFLYEFQYTSEFKEWLMENFRIYDINDNEIEYDENDDLNRFSYWSVYALRPPEGNGDGITEIPPNIRHMTNLTKMELYHHPNLTELPEELSDLQNLTELTIYNCGISIEGLRPIFDLRNLKILMLGRFLDVGRIPFSMGSWAEMPFSESFPLLEELVLTDNKLSYIPSSVFECTSIIKLDISNNQIKDIYDGISQMTQLKQLNLSHNELITINTKIGELQELESLDLRNNIIEYLPSSFGNLVSLRTLNLAGNRKIFHNKLSSDIVAEMRYTYDDDDSIIKGLTPIKTELGLDKFSETDYNSDRFRLMYEQLEKPHPISTLKKLQRLEELHIGNQESDSWIISTRTINTENFHDPIIPAEIGDLVSLKALFARGLGIRELPSEIGKLTSLEVLVLQDNKLKEIPREILELRNLKYLNLKGNNGSFRVKDENGNIIYNNHSLRRDGEYFTYWELSDDLSETQTYIKALLNPVEYMREKLSNSLEYLDGSNSDSESEQSPSDSEMVTALLPEQLAERRNRIRARDEPVQPTNRRRRLGGGARRSTISGSDEMDLNLANTIKILFSKMRDMRLQKQLVSGLME